MTLASRALLGTLGLVGVAALFELIPRAGIVSPLHMPPFSAMLAALGREASTAGFWRALLDTIEGWALGLAIAVVAGVVLGVIIGSRRGLRAATASTIEFLRPIPSVALIPLLVLIYGTRPALKIALAVFGATFPLLFQAMYAVRDVDPVAKDTARSFGLTGVQRLRWVILPSCVPFVVTGVRIAASIALILVVTGEYIVGVEGVGKAVFLAQSGAAYSRMYAYVVTAGLLGLGLNSVLQAGERLLLFWHVSQREEGR